MLTRSLFYPKANVDILNWKELRSNDRFGFNRILMVRVVNFLSSAPSLPLASIGLSLEPHWNLIGTSLEPHWNLAEGSQYFLRIFYMLSFVLIR